MEMVISTHFSRVMIRTSNWNNHFNSWIFRLSMISGWVAMAKYFCHIHPRLYLGGRFFYPFLTVRIYRISDHQLQRRFLYVSHRIHGTGIFTYMKTIKINHPWIGKYTWLVPWIRNGFDLRTTKPPRFGPDVFFFAFKTFRPEEATSFSTTPLEIAEAMEGDEWRIFSEGGRWTHKSYRWWNFKYFFWIFTSKIGEMIQFDQNVTNGWPCFRLNQGFLSNFTNFRMASKGDYDSPFINFVGGSLMKQT